MTSKKSPKVFVVIPAYCESKTIEDVVKGVRQKIPNVIVVDDGSDDNTGRLAKKVGATVIVHKKKLGYEISISDGFKKAAQSGAAIIITFDADGQCKPEELHKFLDPILQKKADVVCGVRSSKAHFGACWRGTCWIRRRISSPAESSFSFRFSCASKQGTRHHAVKRRC